MAMVLSSMVGITTIIDNFIIYDNHCRPQRYVSSSDIGECRQCQQRHTHVEWLKFLRQIDRQTPKDKTLHLIADNYATHKRPAVQEWLAKHPRFSMHFTPTSASWLNMVERFFRDITTERLRRGVFTSVPELVDAIDEYIAHHNTNPKPFIWTKSERDIQQKVIRANSRLTGC